MEKLAPRFVHPFILMGTEIVPLRLQKVCRETRVSVSIKVVECRRECGHPDAVGHGGGYHTTPCGLRSFDLLFKEWIEQKVGKVGVSVKCILDLFEKR